MLCKIIHVRNYVCSLIECTWFTAQVSVGLVWFWLVSPDCLCELDTAAEMIIGQGLTGCHEMSNIWLALILVRFNWNWSQFRFSSLVFISTDETTWGAQCPCCCGCHRGMGSCTRETLLGISWFLGSFLSCKLYIRLCSQQVSNGAIEKL